MAATNSSGTSNLVAVSETSVEGRQAWNASYGLTNYSIRICPAVGVCVTTNVAPDGSFSLSSNYQGRALLTIRKDSGGSQLGLTSFGYDAHGRQSTVTDARNGTMTFAFNAADQVVTNTSPSPDGVAAGLVTVSLYNNMGQLWKTIEPDGTSLTNEFKLTGEKSVTQSQSENSEGSCFRGKGWMARRDEGEYPWWIFD